MKEIKQFKFRLKEVEHTLALMNAEKNGYNSVNKYAKSKILEKSQEDDKKAPLLIKGIVKRVGTFLYDHEIELIKRYAFLNGFSVNRQITHCVRETLRKENPAFYLDKLNDLEKSKNEIDKIGRSIHKIIKGERYLDVKDFMEEIRSVKKLCESVKNDIEDLNKSAITRFK